MKRSLHLFIVAIALICAAFILSLVAYAENDEITISYMQGIGSSSLDKAVGADGIQTVKSGESFILPSKDIETGYALIWTTKEGEAWEAGDSVKFDKDTALYQFKAQEVDNLASLKKAVSSGTSVKLLCDIESSELIKTTNSSIINFYMNGHTISFVNVNSCFGEERSGRRFFGEGKITVATKTTDPNNANVFIMHSHGWYGNNNYLLVGKSITIDAPNASLGVDTNIGSSGYPMMDIYGTVNVYKLLNMNKGGERNPSINIFEDAVVTVSGPRLTGTSGYTGTVSINISGGTLVFDSNDATIFTDNTNSYNSFSEFNKFTITGGSFALNANDYTELLKIVGTSYRLVENTVDSKVYYTVTPYECEHQYNKTTSEANCIHPTQENFLCWKCQHFYMIEHGEKVEHNYEQTSDIPATPTTLGTKTYICQGCENKIIKQYSFDPAKVDVRAIVNTDDGQKEILVSATKLFKLEASGSNGVYTYKIVGINDFDSYLAPDVVEVNIPACISGIQFSEDSSGLKIINIEDYAILNVYSFAKLSALEEINIGSAEVSFKINCANSVIKTINSYAEGAKVHYEVQAFSRKSTITNLVFSTNSYYILEEKAFEFNFGIKEIIIPDYCRVDFRGSAFWENNIEYIYIGRGITKLENCPFNRNYKLKKAVLMEVNELTTDYSFCWSYDWASDNDPTTTPAEIYIHADKISLANRAFYGSHGIIIYTNAQITSTNAFETCESKEENGITYPAYTIIYGIPHKYDTHIYEPTCFGEGKEGYATDCPCMLVEATTYKVFKGCLTNSTEFEEITMTETVIPKKEHQPGQRVNVEYLNGFCSNGLTTFNCSLCTTEYTEKEATTLPLFRFKGYSTPENGEIGLTIGFAIEAEAVLEYETLKNGSFEFGFVACAYELLGGKAPLDKGISHFVTVKKVTNRDMFAYDFVLSGLDNTQKDLPLVMALYVKEGIDNSEKIVYLQEEQADLPAFVTFNQISA